ncbi:MAG: cytochrome c oxidase assembly protein [Chloroflexi bacterium]|nr:MAG: cytochrome c oxidase assembly protein [Chloroflexota bacterium]
MSAEASAFFRSWDPRADVIFVLGILGSLYLTGWMRMRAPQRGRGRITRAANGWRLGAYLGGLALLGIALMSPLDVLGEQLFFLHMLQHMLLTMYVPPLLLLANPLPFVMWGLPPALRRALGVLLVPKGVVRRALLAVTPPAVLWLIYAGTILLWHDPYAYSLAQGDSLVHDLEHISFFVASLLFWWHITGAGPRIHRPMARWKKILFLLGAVPANMLTGITIAFATAPLYAHYAAMPRLFNISVLGDQQLGGTIMWIQGSEMYIIATLILISRMLGDESRKQPLPEAQWATAEALKAPGWRP